MKQVPPSWHEAYYSHNAGV